jgi:hypothetical protein
VSDEQANDGDRVTIGLEVSIPRTFRNVVTIAADQPGTFAHIDVEMVAGRAHLTGVRFLSPLGVNQLDRIDWRHMLREAVKVEGIKNLPAQADAATMTRAVKGVMDTSAAQRRSNNRLTYEELRRVNELAAQGGPGLVADTFNVSTRQANRYIKKAREEIK